jgi:formamidopyrimidine-DNA glycosylase
MPELPEVETTRRGIEPLVRGKTILAMHVREPRLRWPVAPRIASETCGQTIQSVGRRGKYLLLNLDRGSLMIHLGMSGSLRHVPIEHPMRPHDHVEWQLGDGGGLRFNDPRRFGSVHFALAPLEHELLRSLGPEPLDDDFAPSYLHRLSRARRVAIKQHIMNARTVVGLGNIYANEALFRAGIHPFRAAGRIAENRIANLVEAIRTVLSEAIEHGGTTLRDFVGGDGKPGYFKQSLSVYDRAGEPCKHCGETIRLRKLGQRATYYCPSCQT